MGSLDLDRWVPPAVRRRIEDLVDEFDVYRPSGKECLPMVMAELQDLLELDLALAYRVVPTHDGWDLDFLHVRGGISNDYFAAKYLAALRRASVVGAYDPSRPPPLQRNRVVRPRALMDERSWAECAAGLASEELGLLGFDELRVLVCNGASVLAWVGGFRAEQFTRCDRAILRALAAPLRRRLELERRLKSAELTEEALGMVLETVDAAAFVVHRSGRVLYTNDGGRAMMRQPDIVRRLRDAIEGGPGFRVSEILVRGIVDHCLVVVDPDESAPLERMLEARRRSWSLTRRQTDVLRLVVRGDDNKSIAAELGISPRTVEAHVAATLDKAGVTSRAQMIAAFWQHL